LAGEKTRLNNISLSDFRQHVFPVIIEIGKKIARFCNAMGASSIWCNLDEGLSWQGAIAGSAVRQRQASLPLRSRFAAGPAEPV